MYNESSTNIVCQPCLIDNCIECDDNNENHPCLKCSPGYFVQEGVCIQCSSACSNSCIGPNSSDCLGSYNDKSASDYYLTSDEFCSICSHNCSNCPFSFDNCTTCEEGYYLNSSNCYPCPENYKYCSSFNTRIECFEYYHLDSNECKQN